MRSRKRAPTLLTTIPLWGVVGCAEVPPGTPDNAATFTRALSQYTINLDDKLRPAPPEVLADFAQPSGIAPTPHPLSARERAVAQGALDLLPTLNRRVVNERLSALYFIDGMPNTALTFPAGKDPDRLYSIAINAAVLDRTIGEWATAKERSCFAWGPSPTLSVRVECEGDPGALLYILLHETTHVVDACRHITPAYADPEAHAAAADSVFTRGTWSAFSTPAPAFRFEKREQIGFYDDGGRIAAGDATALYHALMQTPFVSLYASRNWAEDLAEYVTVYHLGQVLGHPYRVTVSADGRTIAEFEPMRSQLVRDRAGLMKQFYER